MSRAASRKTQSQDRSNSAFFHSQLADCHQQSFADSLPAKFVGHE
jgi:hypothetical protein